MRSTATGKAIQDSGVMASVVRRQTAILPVALANHLGVVVAPLTTLPYGEFAHGIQRGAALLKCAIERRQPNRLQLADD
jgi:citrate/tricarballylate utilization protein